MHARHRNCARTNASFTWYGLCLRQSASEPTSSYTHPYMDPHSPTFALRMRSRVYEIRFGIGVRSHQSVVSVPPPNHIRAESQNRKHCKLRKQNRPGEIVRHLPGKSTHTLRNPLLGLPPRRYHGGTVIITIIIIIILARSAHTMRANPATN